jgi:Tol biopolymer transport system component
MGGYPSITKDGRIYYMSSIRKGYGETDLYRSEFIDGKYSDGQNLGGMINTKYIELDSFVAPDESYLIFCSDRPGGYGEYDLYVSFKDTDEVWKEPINMGPEINSVESVTRPSVTPDGKYLFFCKHFDDHDAIYWVDTKVLHDLKQVGLK